MSTEWVRDDMMSPISEVEQFGVKGKELRSGCFGMLLDEGC